MNATAVCLSLTNIFTLMHSANVPSLAFTVTVQHTSNSVEVFHHHSSNTHFAGWDITQRNTRSFLEHDYRRHTQLATQLRGQSENQNHSRQSAVNATTTASSIYYYRHTEKVKKISMHVLYYTHTRDSHK